jgi:DNA processing protein
MGAMQTLQFKDFRERAVSPFVEMGAYEALWDKDETSFRTIADLFRKTPDAVPSDFVSLKTALRYAGDVRRRFHEAGITQFGVRVHGAGEYPQKLRDAKHPIELLYFQGWWDLVESPCVAVVGTREPSDEGRSRAHKLARCLVEDSYTVVSGLATGIDTVAHTTAMEAGGRTIAVIGTPLSHVYPKENAALQREIADKFLVISQVPVCRYERQDYRINRFFFPERNVTMSALTEATIIVEAGETSGTLVQAKAAVDQGRKLFILDSCFRKKDLTWPQKFQEKGAIRVTDYDDIRKHLSQAADKNRRSDAS